MRRTLQRRPSASMVVAVTALVFAVSGTAVAASHLFNGDKLIKKGSLSGNRLRSHTLTGSQINLNKLGKVPSAKTADLATNAITAANATNAANAATVGGQVPGAFEPASNWSRSGLVMANQGQTVTLQKFGPFTLSLKCTTTSGHAVSEIDATSSEANSDGYGTIMTTAGTSYLVLGTTSSTLPSENDDNSADFFTPSGKTYIADLTEGVNWPSPGVCFANSLASPS